MGDVEIIIQKKIRELSVQKKLIDKRIFVFGYNIYWECINNFLCYEGHTICGLIDNDKKKQELEICNFPIYDPKSICWGAGDVVLIASKHKKSMMQQIFEMSEEVEIFNLVDLEDCRKEWETKQKFWIEDNYELEIQKLHQGKKVYDRIKREESLFVFPFPSIGDAFLIGLYFSQYKLMNQQKVKVVVGSKGAYEIMQMFNIKEVEIVSEKELYSLFKFVSFCEKNMKKVFICSWMFVFESMARYKKLSFSEFCAKYVFGLENKEEVNFPSIWDVEFQEFKLENKGLSKGKTIIVAPYANSVEELPIQFWEELVKRLIKMGYYVFTNVSGNQKAIKGSKSIKIPLSQLGNYLEFAGYFISLRSGLCDIVGHSICKQIVIFRDRKIEPQSSQIAYYNLHPGKISENAIQLLYHDTSFYINIDRIMSCL